MITKLPLWVLTNDNPSVYDMESGTAIEQTARVYAKMQELIDDYNKFVTAVNKHIEEYENGLTKDYESFKLGIRQAFQDFIGTVDLKIREQDQKINDAIQAQDDAIFNKTQAQDKKIANAVSYMTENLQSSLNLLLIEMRESGELDETLVNSFDDLNDRFVSFQNSVMTENDSFTETLINVKSFGAVGDGATDDTNAIKSAVNALTDNCTLYFPNGVYIFEPTQNKDALISITAKNNVTIKSDGAKIKVKPNQHPYVYVINPTNCDNLTIRDIEIEGDRIGHDYTTVSNTHEFGYGIYIIGDNAEKPSNVNILNCNIHDMTGDAIVTKNGVSTGKIRIFNCNLHHCRRQGISILDSDTVVVETCNIHHIGTFDGVNGTSPASGIDIEPNSGTEGVNKVVINNCEIYDCDTYAIISGATYINRVKNIFITNSRMSDIVICPHVYMKNSLVGRFGEGIGVIEYVKRFSTEYGIIENSTIYCEAETTTTLHAQQFRNCFIECRNSDARIYARLYNCRIENAVLSSANNTTEDWKGAFNSSFQNCKILFKAVDPIVSHFNNCVLLLCTPQTVQGAVVFNNCCLDKKYFAQGIYNGGYVAETTT